VVIVALEKSRLDRLQSMGVVSVCAAWATT